MFKIKTYDHFGEKGLKVFDSTKYIIDSKLDEYDGILVHSTSLHDVKFCDNLKSIVRVGAGVNTIPVNALTKKGVVVFNCPGGNANAVKELTFAAIIMLMRNGFKSMEWVKTLSNEESIAGKTIEKGKENFKGPELYSKTIGIIGVGAIGSKMAKTAYDFDMKVIGYDPYLNNNQKQELSKYLYFTDNLDELLCKSDIVTIHIPLNENNKFFIGKKEIDKMKDGVYLINYARGPILDNVEVCNALDSGKIKGYATDFPTPEQIKRDDVLCTPHLGAGTPEADDNCSIMAARQTIDYLENGNIVNSVNYPSISVSRTKGSRICVMHENRIGMLGKITDCVVRNELNIENLSNKAKDDIAYTIMDFNTKVNESLSNDILKICGVFRVRIID